MNKLQALYSLAVMLPLFSLLSAVEISKTRILSTAIRDLEVLIKLNKTTDYRISIPQNITITEACSLTVLACYGDPLVRMERHWERKSYPEHRTIYKVLTNIQGYMDATLHKEVKLKELCKSQECVFRMVLEKPQKMLENLLNLLQSLITKK